MRLPSKREWVLLALVPALILVAAGAAQDGKDQTATIAEPKAAAPKTNTNANASTNNANRAADTGELDLAPLRREPDAREPANAFTSKSWYVPPPAPPPPPPAPPPPPTAPPLPFAYLGRFQDKGRAVIFLVKDDRVLTVKEGDIIEGNYRVDGIVGSKLELTYLPLDIKQALNIGNEE
jgi:hypothetical protein